MPDFRYEIRQQLARLMGETVIGTPETDLGKNKFGVPKLSVYEDDYFLEWHGRFYLGTHRNTNFVVTGFGQTNGVLTFKPPLTEAVTKQDLFELFMEFNADEYNDAINLAIDRVKEEALTDAVNQSLVIVASKWEYDVPTGLLYIERIIEESGTANLYSVSADKWDTRWWDILRGANPKIWIDNKYVTPTAGRHLRLIGQQSPSKLTSDDQTTDISMVYLIYQAKAFLHLSRSVEKGDDHWNAMVIAQGIADREKRSLLVAGRGKKVKY